MTATAKISIETPRGAPARGGALEWVKASATPPDGLDAVELRIDGSDVPFNARRLADQVAISAWCDTRGQAPGLHEITVNARWAQGEQATDSQLFVVSLGEPAADWSATTGPAPDVAVARAGDRDLAAALARTARGGPPLMLLGADGEPAPGALVRIAGEVRDADGVDVLIGDEAALIGDGRWVRWRKRAFQPEALPAIDQVGPVLVVGPRAAAILRAALDAVPRDLYAFALELLDHDLQTYAVPHVLALTPAARLPADGAIARAAIERLAARRGRRVTVAAGPATGVREVRWPLDDPPEVVAVIPSRTPALVARCLAAVHARTHYPALRVVVVDSSDEGSEMRRVVAEAPLAATCVPYPAGERFNYQRAVNLGADQAGGADVLFLNDDVEPLEPGWLTAMVELMTLPGVGIVGALLRHPDGRLQHAGVQIGEGFGHRYHDAPGDACGHRFELLVPGNVEAVTGACMLVRGEVLRQLDGHDERFVHVYGDVDLCFRAAERGWRTAWTPRAELEHLESASYGSELDSDDIRRFGDRWHRDRDQRPSRQVRI